MGSVSSEPLQNRDCLYEMSGGERLFTCSRSPHRLGCPHFPRGRLCLSRPPLVFCPLFSWHPISVLTPSHKGVQSTDQ